MDPKFLEELRQKYIKNPPEGMTAKLVHTPPEVREKIRSSLSRIVNEGASGLICLIL